MSEQERWEKKSKGKTSWKENENKSTGCKKKQREIKSFERSRGGEREDTNETEMELQRTAQEPRPSAKQPGLWLRPVESSEAALGSKRWSNRGSPKTSPHALSPNHPSCARFFIYTLEKEHVLAFKMCHQDKKTELVSQVFRRQRWSRAHRTGPAGEAWVPKGPQQWRRPVLSNHSGSKSRTKSKSCGVLWFK